ncbi:unnamed protein product, partial [marine sediment metagenome]
GKNYKKRAKTGREGGRTCELVKFSQRPGANVVSKKSPTPGPLTGGEFQHANDLRMTGTPPPAHKQDAEAEAGND